MSRGTVHIVAVDLPGVPLEIAEGLESEGLGALGAAAELGAVEVIVSFGDGSVYSYPGVPITYAAAVKADPEGAFPTIKLWPGYHRIR